MHIVCLEDDPGLRAAIGDTMNYLAADAHVAMYGSSDDVLAAADRQSAQLYLLDVRVPGKMNGLALAQHLREQGDRGIIVLVSAYPRPDSALIEELDCQWLSKPITLEQLSRCLALATGTDRSSM